MAVAICLGAFGGKYVQDHWTHWKPWTMLIGLMIGIGAAALAILRVVNEHTAAMKQKAEMMAERDATAPRPDGSIPGGLERSDPSPKGKVEIRTSTLDPSPPTATPSAQDDGDTRDSGDERGG